MIHENNCIISTKKGKGKIPLFCGNGERVSSIYGLRIYVWIFKNFKADVWIFEDECLSLAKWQDRLKWACQGTLEFFKD